MQNINIGKSGIAVPFLGMGTWAIGGGGGVSRFSLSLFFYLYLFL